MKLRSLLALSILLFLHGCTTPGKADSAARDKDQAAHQVQTPSEPPGAECQILFQERVDLQKTTLAIDCWSAALEENIDDESQIELRTALSYAHYFLARYHLMTASELNKDAIVKNAQAAQEHALAALSLLSPEFEEALRRQRSIDDLLHQIDTSASETLLHYARALNLWAQHTSLTAQVAHEKTVDTIMSFIAENHPEAGAGAAHRYFGRRWIERPLHKSPEKSAENFNKSLSYAPDFLMTRLIRAKTLALATQDQALFEDDLKVILEAESDEIPENYFARQLARQLLDRADELF